MWVKAPSAIVDCLHSNIFSDHKFPTCAKALSVDWSQHAMSKWRSLDKCAKASSVIVD